jgi:hypothetical protein
MTPLVRRIEARKDLQMGGEMRKDQGAAAGQKNRKSTVSRGEKGLGKERGALGGREKGGDAMRKTASRVLNECYEAIVGELAKRATNESHVQSIRLLCDLADEEKELSAALLRRSQESLADRWENEPEWTALIEDAKSDPWSSEAPGPAARS